MLDRDNCIARFRALAGKLSQYSDAAVPDVLTAALGANADTMEFYRRLVAFEDLGKRARHQLDEIADDSSYDLYVEAIDSMVAIFDQLNMRENWTKYAAPFNPHTMALLQTCDRAVGRRLTTIPPSPEVISEALMEVQEAIGLIREADIEAEAKELLLEILREAEGALQSYDISGLAGLRRAIERMVGAYAVHQKVIDQYRGHDAVKRFWKACGRVVIVAQMVHYIKELPGVGNLVKMLTE